MEIVESPTETLIDLTPLAAEKKILLVRDYDARALGRANIDGERIAQVLSNLLGNALKFTPAGGTVFLGARLAGADALRIEVRDSGPGIGAEHPTITVIVKYYQSMADSAVTVADIPYPSRTRASGPRAQATKSGLTKPRSALP